MATDGTEVKVTREILESFEKGEIEFGELPESAQTAILEGKPLEIDGEEATPATPPDQTQGDPAPENTDPPKDKALDEFREKYIDAERRANQYKQKFEAKERLLTKLSTDAEFARKYLIEERGLPLVPGEDPRVTARLALAVDPTYSLPAPPQDSMTDMGMSGLDTRVGQYLDLGESFSSADSKWAKVYSAFEKAGRMQDLEHVEKNPEYAKQVFASLGIEPIKDLNGYLKAAEAVQTWMKKPEVVDFDLTLQAYGLKPKQTRSAPGIPTAPRRSDEVPTLPIGQGTPPPSADAQAALVDQLLERSQKDPDSLTAQERDTLFKALGII